MTKHTHETPIDEQHDCSIEQPLSCGYAPYALTGEYLMMIPLRLEHQYRLYEEIYSQPEVMHYFGTGKCYNFDEYQTIHLNCLKQNLSLEYSQNTGCLSRFTWAVVTHDGIAGKFKVFPSGERTEFAFCISPRQQGKALARRASELVVAYMGNETLFTATAHPLNKASSKTLEQVHYPNGKFVFFRDPERQNVSNIYGTNQPRDYFLSQKDNKFSFFSFRKGVVQIDASIELEETQTAIFDLKK